MASAYLSRTPSGNGNKKTWTYSAWVKRTGVGTWGGILDAGDGSSWTDIYFYNTDILVVRHYTSGSAPIYIETDRLFRDANAGGDTFSADARVLGVKIFFTTDAANDA